MNIENYIGGNFVAPSSGNYLDVVDPAVPGKVIARCAISTAKDVETAVETAHKALPAWSKMTIKARAAIMMKFHSIIEREAEDLAQMIVLENGKNYTEAMAEGMRGLWR
jgi:malonate-semialdehyde dehydrogenase (acetylating) / methylmalonate-semialdehyde dehydrogenase